MSAALAHCRDCGKRTDRVVSLPNRNAHWAALPDVRHEWLCASCEYLRAHPDAKRGSAYPREMRKAKLQADAQGPIISPAGQTSPLTPSQPVAELERAGLERGHYLCDRCNRAIGLRGLVARGPRFTFLAVCPRCRGDVLH